MSALEAVVGGWTQYHTISDKEQEVFNEAMTGSAGGVIYNPLSVATQIVAGTNYRFKCTASQPPADVIWDVTVEINAPLNGALKVTGITRN